MKPNLKPYQMHYIFAHLDEFEILKEFIEAADMAYEQLKKDGVLLQICLRTNYLEFRKHFNEGFKTLITELLPPFYINLFFIKPEKSEIPSFNPRIYPQILKERLDAYAEDFREVAQTS